MFQKGEKLFLKKLRSVAGGGGGGGGRRHAAKKSKFISPNWWFFNASEFNYRAFFYIFHISPHYFCESIS